MHISQLRDVDGGSAGLALGEATMSKEDRMVEDIVALCVPARPSLFTTGRHWAA